MGLWIVSVIWKMGFPLFPNGGAASALLGKLPGKSAVRRALREDSDLHADIRAEVGVEFFQAVERGKVWSANAEGFLFRLTQRKTWKLATVRAAELQRTLVPTTEQELLDGIASGDLLPDDAVDRDRARRRFLRAAARLATRDWLLIEGRLDGTSYEDLCRDLESTPEALRKRFHDLVLRLVEQVRQGQPSAA